MLETIDFELRETDVFIGKAVLSALFIRFLSLSVKCFQKRIALISVSKLGAVAIKNVWLLDYAVVSLHGYHRV